MKLFQEWFGILEFPANFAETAAYFATMKLCDDSAEAAISLEMRAQMDDSPLKRKKKALVSDFSAVGQRDGSRVSARWAIWHFC